MDHRLSAVASRHLAGIQASFEYCLRDAGCAPGRAGELGGGGAMLMLMNQGMRVSSRTALPLRHQLAPIETTFRLLRSALR